MYTGIVVGTDQSDTAASAVAHAAALAKAFDAPLHLVSAYRVAGASAAEALAPLGVLASDGEWVITARDDTERFLKGLADRYRAEGLTVDAHVAPGDPVAAMISVADSTDSDLIVVGNRGMKGVRRALGSVPNSVAHKATCHVLVVATS